MEAKKDPNHSPPAAAVLKPLLLLVDDVPRNLQVLAGLLHDEYEIALATDGEQAISMAMERPPVLILLDVMMPKLDGFEVCRRLKKTIITSSIPIIFVTARTETADIVQGFTVGGVDYITKPYNHAELRARVRTHVQLHQLKSLLYMCSYCGRVRNDQNHWERLDLFIHRKTGRHFSHGVCGECSSKMLKDLQLE